MTAEFSKNAINKLLPAIIAELEQMCGPDCHEFTQGFKARVQNGAEVYGDVSFSRTKDHLCDEVDAETFDVPGWLWILDVVAQNEAETDQQKANYDKLHRLVMSIDRDAYRIWHKMKRVRKLCAKNLTTP
jgi:hypothetical protein